VERDASVTVTFSEPVRAVTVNAQSIRLLDPADQPLPSDVSLSTDGRTATLTPRSRLEPSLPYAVQIDTTVADLAGNPLAAAVSARFRTRDLRFDAGVRTPADGTNGTWSMVADARGFLFFAQPLGRMFRSEVQVFSQRQNRWLDPLIMEQVDLPGAAASMPVLVTDHQRYVHAFWYYYSQTEPTRWRTARFDTQSLTWSAPQIAEPAPASAGLVAATPIDDNRLLTIWSGTVTSARVFDAPSATWSAPVPIALPGDPISEHVKRRSDGRVTAIFRRSIAGPSVSYRVVRAVFDPSTNTWSDHAETDIGAPFVANIGFAGDTAIVAWSSFDGMQDCVRTARIESGVSWTLDAAHACWPSTPSTSGAFVALHSDQSGQFALTWSSVSQLASRATFETRYVGGAWTPTVEACPRDCTTYMLDGNGGAFVVGLRSVAADYEVTLRTRASPTAAWGTTMVLFSIPPSGVRFVHDGRGTLTLVWREVLSFSSDRVWARRAALSTGIATPATQLWAGSGSFRGDDLTLAIGPRGDVVVAGRYAPPGSAQPPNDLLTARFRSVDNTWTSAEVIGQVTRLYPSIGQAAVPRWLQRAGQTDLVLGWLQDNGNQVDFNWRALD
jgi:hypothetical protein